MDDNKNMICDLETGICKETEAEDTGLIDFSQTKKTLDVYYITDPICSHCWAQEPVFRRFTEQYGHHFNFHTVMGGLLEKWHDGPIDPANGIYKPADVAGHWREVGVQTRMPIDGNVMIQDPVQSSFPASRVFKVIQRDHSDKMATVYLRRVREAVFVNNRNISDAAVLADVIDDMGLDGSSIVSESEKTEAHNLLQEDFALTAQLGARGFPTIIMINADNQGVKIVGGRSFESYVDGLEQVMAPASPEPKQQPNLLTLLEKETFLFSREIEEMYGLAKEEVPSFVESSLKTTQYESREFLGENYFTLSK
ncbi:hypothetical protein GCM10022378_20240 [Salinicoccus jeotgali]|uniref:Dithiol-disulfide isomerase n=1 Tax=Salinicoccus jeotgali TaxID=381634 RepID=A0ABP7F5R1_9STAP